MVNMGETARSKYTPTEKQVDEFHRTISRNLRNRREAMGMSMEELARQLGVSYQTISRWENGTYIPTPTFLLALSKLYGCKPSDFYEGVEGM